MNNKDKPLYNLLLENDKKKIEQFIIANGKGPKPVCPIIYNINYNKEDNNAKK